MSEYFCHDCAASKGLMASASPANLWGTRYQLGKYIKHTIPSGRYDVQSVFDDPAFQTIEEYVVNTSASGCVEIDDQGRVNVLWVAGSGIGVTYHHGTPVCPADTAKLVLWQDGYRVHSYPTGSGANLRSEKCMSCGCPVVR